MPVWDDQDMGRRDRVDVAEGGHLFVAIYNRRFCFIGSNNSGIDIIRVH